MQNLRWILGSLALCQVVLAAPPTKSLGTNIACSYRCAGAKRVSSVLPQVFDPDVLKLRRGNGEFWGLLTTTLNLWTGDWCLAEAVAECGSLEKIREVAATELSSGEWHTNVPLTCELQTLAVISPYAPASHSLLADQGLGTAVPDYFPTALSTPLERKPKTCVHPIHPEVCAGDCMVEVPDLGGWVETLASAKPNISNTETVCGDDLVAELKGTHYSRAVYEHFCNRFLSVRLFAGKSGANIASCAATRFTPHCEDLIDALVEVE